MKIYAGRTEIPKINKHVPTYEELAARAKEQEQYRQPKVQQFTKDKITFSQQGLKSAKDMRNYLNENGLNQRIDIKANLEELDLQLHTKTMDYASNFLYEMDEVVEQQRAAWGSQVTGDSLESAATLRAKAYQVVYDRIVDEFARNDRDTTYVIDKVTGVRREETVEDRLEELKSAYDLKTTFIASSKKAMAQIQEAFGGQKSLESPQIIEQKTKKAYMCSVREPMFL